MENFKAILFLSLTMLILDFLWLGVISKNIFKKEIGNLMKSKFSFFSAFFVYVLLVIGLVVFVLNNLLYVSIWAKVFLGGFFGFVCYGVYELTNYSIIKGWSLKIVVLDMIWGAFLCASSIFVASLV